MDKDLIKFFTQCPNLILYGLPDVAIQDKWALLALTGICWDRSKSNKTLKELEGPYKLSLREILSITGVKHNLLRNTEGKNPREGVLDRLQDDGWITVIEAKPINVITDNLGRSQTYLYIHLEKLWTENLSFSEGHQIPSRLVSESSFARIVDGETVRVANSNVRKIGDGVNSEVHNSTAETRKSSPETRNASVKLVPIRSNTALQTNEDKEEILSQHKILREPPFYLREGISQIIKKHGGDYDQCKTEALVRYNTATGTMEKKEVRVLFENAIIAGIGQGVPYFLQCLDQSLTR